MKIIQLDSGEKFYETCYGVFPSVTTILKATMPEYQKEKLTNWRNRNGSQADLIRQEAAIRGEIIHQLIEAKLKGKSLECPENIIEY